MGLVDPYRTNTHDASSAGAFGSTVSRSTIIESTTQGIIELDTADRNARRIFTEKVPITSVHSYPEDTARLTIVWVSCGFFGGQNQHFVPVSRWQRTNRFDRPVKSETFRSKEFLARFFHHLIGILRHDRSLHRHLDNGIALYNAAHPRHATVGKPETIDSSTVFSSTRDFVVKPERLTRYRETQS
jgi:hypothetical protein